MNRYKVFAIYFAFALGFAAVAAVLLAVITAAALCLPAGLLFAVLGAAMLIFNADFVVTELSPLLMLFGGLFAACASGFVGLLAVRVGFAAARLFARIRRRCDRLRGW